MSKTFDKLMKTNKGIENASIISDSEILNEKETIPLPVYAFNIANSGSLDKGFQAGITVVAGQSKSFKTLIGLIHAAAYLKQYPDAFILLYDTEFGITEEYLKMVGIDTSKVLHRPISDVEQLKANMTQTLDELERGDRVFMLIDSVGNLASRKETDDALDDRAVADMTRAKQLKSFFRIVTPKLVMKNIPIFAINHVYKEIGVNYSKDIVGGGEGGKYAANTTWIVTRRQQKKPGKELEGYQFTLNVEKSRKIKEGSKVPFVVNFEGGISKYSGLLELAVEGGFVERPNKQRYKKHESYGDDKQYFEKDTYNSNFWKDILDDPDFNEFIQHKFVLSENEIVKGDDEEESLPDVEEEDEIDSNGVIQEGEE